MWGADRGADEMWKCGVCLSLLVLGCGSICCRNEIQKSGGNEGTRGDDTD